MAERKNRKADRGKKEKGLPREVKQMVEYKLMRLNEIKKDLREYKLNMIPSSTPSYSGMPGGSDPEARPMENLVMKMASDAYVYEAERTVKIFERVLERQSAQDRKLISLIYWRRGNTVESAAWKCNMSKSMAYNHVNRILTELAKEIGYINA